MIDTLSQQKLNQFQKGWEANQKEISLGHLQANFYFDKRLDCSHVFQHHGLVLPLERQTLIF